MITFMKNDDRGNMPIRFVIVVLLLALTLICFLPFVTVRAQSVEFGSNLYYGLTHNDNVEALQEFLTEQGDYSGPLTGNFYSLTLAAVKRFQGENGLPTSGYFGVLSRGVANGLLDAQLATPPIDEVGTSTQPSQPATQSVATSSNSSTPQTGGVSVGGVVVAQASPVQQAPTCSLATVVDNYYGTTWQAKLSWSYTEGATAIIKTTNGGPINLMFGQGRNVPPDYVFPSVSSPFFNLIYGGPIFSDTDYEMDVTLNGMTGSCTAHAAVPSRPPQN